MKKTLLLIIILFVFLTGCFFTSEEKIDINPLDNYSLNLNIIETINDITCPFIATGHYDTQKTILYSKGCLDVNQKSNGGYVQYFQNGQKQIEGNYLNEKRQGQWNLYGEDGNIQIIFNYENGLLNGEQIFFDQNENNKIIEVIEFENAKLKSNQILNQNIEIKYANDNNYLSFSKKDDNSNILKNCIKDSNLNDSFSFDCEGDDNLGLFDLSQIDKQGVAIDCGSNGKCFNYYLNRCRNAVLNYPKDEQVLFIYDNNETVCNVYGYYPNLINGETDNYDCNVNKNGIDVAKNIVKELNLNTFDLWVDVFLEKECTGSLVDKTKENPDYFFERFKKIKNSNNQKACIFSNECGVNQHCVNLKCMPNSVFN